MEKPKSFADQLKNYLSQLTPERVVGAGGLAILCAASALALTPNSAQPFAAALGGTLSALGLEVLADVLQQLYEELLSQPSDNDLNQVAKLAGALERDIKRQAKLRAEIGAFLDNYSSFQIAEEVVQGNQATHGWLLVQIYNDLTLYRDDFDRIHQTLDEIKAFIKRLEQPRLSTHIPLQRPPRPEHFIGRAEEITQILTGLQPRRIVTLCGPGGIGKSALAAEVVWRLAPGNNPPDRFPDGIIFHSFYNQPQADLALEKIALAYGEESRPTPRDAAQRALAGRQALLILDGTEAADNLPAVLEVRGQCGVIVTSRHRQDAVAERQDLSPLAPEEALKLLQAWGQEQVQDQNAAKRICELVGWLPLAVRLVGRYLAETEETAAEYLEWLAETPLEALDPEGEQRRLQSVPWLLERSLAQVSETSQHLLAVVGQLALAPFAVAPVAEAMGLAIRATRRWLGELVSYGLLLRSGERYEVSHALIHTYARQRLGGSPEGSSRLAAYYTSLAEEQSSLGVEGYNRLDEERAHLMRVLNDCVERKDWAAAQNLVRAVVRYLNTRSHWTERVAAIEMGIVAALAAGNRRDEGTFLNLLGLAYRDVGQIKQAIELYEQALIIAQEIGDQRRKGTCLRQLGFAFRQLGEIEQAIEYVQQALIIAQEIGNQRDEGACLGQLGLAYRDLGQMEQASEFYQQALIIAQEIGDQRGEGTWLGELGLAYRDVGQIKQAIEFYQQALIIAQEIGDRRYEGIHLGQLGSAYHVLGEIEQAIEYVQQALIIAQEIGDRLYEATWLNQLGSAFRKLGQIKQAIEFYQQALIIAQEIGDRRRKGTCLGQLGLAYRDLGQMEQAGEFYQQALIIAQEIGDQLGEGDWLYQLGNLHKNQFNIPLARQYLEQSLAVYEEIKSPSADWPRRLLAKLEDS